MNARNVHDRVPARGTSGFTLLEVVISMAIAAMLFVGIIRGYILSNKRAEWSAYSLAAQSLALQRLEQARACKWDPEATPPVDQFVSTNFPSQLNVLDIPYSSTNYVYATNLTTITTISTLPPLKQIQVDCTWSFTNGRAYTNRVVCYRSPDT